MDKRIRLHVFTPEGRSIEEEAVSVIAPGEAGHVGFLPNHAPLVTTLKPGMLKWRAAAGPWKAARIGSGLLEVARNRVTVLTDDVQPPTVEAHA